MSVGSAIRTVVSRGNCTGCGGCAALFPGIEMRLDHDGYLRPEASSLTPQDQSRTVEFRAICPGVSIHAKPALGARTHPIFGPNLSVWAGHAVDPEIQRTGSSGGVLTALSAWLVESGRSVSGTAVSSSSPPTRSVPVQLMTRDDALRAAGSRYAPVATAQNLSTPRDDTFFVGKPCEAEAVRRLSAVVGQGERPLLLSFFCAGVPSQWSTNKLLDELGVDEKELTSLRYRGDGWPGNFTATERDGKESRRSYEDSWGNVLGRSLQARCKVCVDGTGESADISVGDFWETDERGYPLFEEGAGNSVVIARTPRGHQLLMEASSAGVISLVPVDLEQVARIQPLQRERRLSLPGRLIGRLLLFRPGPRYIGYGLFTIALRNPKQTVRGVLGIIGRHRRSQKTLVALRSYAPANRDGA